MITPEDLCKTGKEDGEQSALICWTALPETKNQYPDAIKIFAINNNAGKGDSSKGAYRGMKARMTGTKAGVCDLFLPVARFGFHGLFIEMKQAHLKPKKEGGAGGVSEAQSIFIEQSRRDGYACAVCYGWKEARDTLRSYLAFVSGQ